MAAMLMVAAFAWPVAAWGAQNPNAGTGRGWHGWALAGLAVVVVALAAMEFHRRLRLEREVRERTAALHESESRVAATLRSIGEGMICTDASGRITGLNKLAEHLTGWSLAEARGRPLADVFRVFNTRTRAALGNPVERALSAGTTVGLGPDTVLVARHGAERQIVDTCAPIREESGKVLGAVLLFRDVTEEYRQRQELRQSEENLRLLMDGVTVALVIVDESTRLIEQVNPAAERLLGGTGEQLVGRSCIGLTQPQPAPLSPEPRPPAAGDNADGVVTRLDGGRVPVLKSVKRIRLGGRDKLLQSLIDISERKRAEEEAMARAERLVRQQNLLAEVAVSRHVAEGDVKPLAQLITERVSTTMDIGRVSVWLFAADQTRLDCVDLYELSLGTHSVGTSLRAEEYRAEFEALKSAKYVDAHDALTDPRTAGYVESYLKPLRITAMLDGAIRDAHRTLGVLCLEHVGRAHRWEADEISFCCQLADQLALTLASRERRGGEEALAKAKAHYEFLVQNASDGIHILDMEGNLVEASPSFYRLLGYPEDAPPRLQVYDWDVRWRPRELAARIVALVDRPEVFETRHRRRDGQVIDVEINARGMEIDGRHYLYASAREITERKRHESALLAAKREAELANKAKSEFLANMSHELRTPLNGVLGLTDLLQGTALTDEQRRFAQGIRGNGAALLHVIDDILDASRIESRKLELESVDFSLSDLLAATSARLSTAAAAKALRWSCVADPGVPARLRGDPDRLRQVLNYLLDNAVKFTAAGEVAARVSLVSATALEVRLCFAVSDTGCGIPAQKLDALFVKFVQLDSSTTRRYSGAGLGLANARELVERMGGEIGVSSEEGRGSRFWFTVRVGRQPNASAPAPAVSPAPSRAARAVAPPRAASPAPSASPPQDDTGSGGKGDPAVRASQRLLLAEDNPTNRDVAVGILTRLGWRVDAVTNGAEALQALAGGRYDLVLMDLQMPVMDGLEAARQVRDARSPVLDHEVPIVALTAHLLAEDRERCLRAGMDDYLTKPIEVDALTSVIERWLGARKAFPTGTPNPNVASSSTPPQPPVFDRAGLMKRVMNDTELAHTVMATFLEELPRQLEQIRAAKAADDLPTLTRLAHTLKGAAANVGGEVVRTVALALEKAGHARHGDALWALLPELDRECARLRVAMEQELSRA